MLVGPAGGGKTRAIDTLQSALKNGVQENAAAPRIHRLYPKSVSRSQFMGETDPVTGEFSTGILAATWEKHNSAVAHLEGVIRPPYVSWFVFDGPVDPDCCDGLLSALEEPRSLILASGDHIMAAPLTRIIFETDSL
jgi:hypothetical protein